MIPKKRLASLKARMRSNTGHFFMYSRKKTTIQSKINSHFRLYSIHLDMKAENE